MSKPFLTVNFILFANFTYVFSSTLISSTIYSSFVRVLLVIVLLLTQVVIPFLLVAFNSFPFTLNTTPCSGIPDETFFKFKLYFPSTSGLSMFTIIVSLGLSNVTFIFAFLFEFTVVASVISIVSFLYISFTVFPYATVILSATYKFPNCFFCTFTVIGEANSNILFFLSSTSFIVYVSTVFKLFLLISHDSTTVILPFLSVVTGSSLTLFSNVTPLIGLPFFVFITFILYFPLINLLGIVTVIMLFATLASTMPFSPVSNSTFNSTSCPIVDLFSPWYNIIFSTPNVPFCTFLYTSRFIGFFNLRYKLSTFTSSIVYVSTLLISLLVNSTVVTSAIPSVFVAAVIIVSSTSFISVDIPNTTPSIGLLLSVAFTFLTFSEYEPFIFLFGIFSVIVCVASSKVAVTVTVVPSFSTTPFNVTDLFPSLDILPFIPVASSFIPVIT